MKQQEKLQIFLQYLNNHGYYQTIKELIQKTSYNQLQQLDSKVDSSIVSKITTYIQNHDFDQLEQIFNTYVNQEKKQKCMFIIVQNHYIELLQQQKINEAVELLRGRLQDCCLDEQQKHQLANLIIESEIQPLTCVEIIRQILLICHQEIGVLQPNRLMILMHQAQANKILECKNHCKLESNYLISQKHLCTQKLTKKIIREQHLISIVQYSNDLSLQVQVSDKVNVIIYQQQLQNNSELQLNKIRTLNDYHQSEILSVTISPCNQYIGTTSKDKTAIIFELRKNKQLVLNAHQSPVQDMIWVLQSNFVNGNGGINKNSQKQELLELESLLQNNNQTSDTLKLLQYKIWTIANDGWLFEWDQGTKIYSLKTEEKVKKMHYDQNKDSLIIVSEYKISIYQLSKKQLIRQLSLNDQIIDVKIEKAQTFIIILSKNINYQFTYYSLPNLEFVKLFIEHNPKLLIKQFDIGWHNNNLIVCCTNEGVTIMWHIQKGQLPFFRKQIHKGPINLVSIEPLSFTIRYFVEQDSLLSQIQRNIAYYSRVFTEQRSPLAERSMTSEDDL
ncbi:unnamed protein product [Paramecium primaurelia]|uniref:LisH domain-containing protein n=1 Tax=Paramecium primaurelia TaxID=5886 RepID=A0A8S1NL43_PARPR|nr:unnamed protein product [Paramecium primaurelia]